MKEIRLIEYYDDEGELCNFMLNEVVDKEIFIEQIELTGYMQSYVIGNAKVYKKITCVAECWVKIVGCFRDGERVGQSFICKIEKPKNGKGWFKGMVADVETFRAAVR